MRKLLSLANGRTAWQVIEAYQGIALIILAESAGCTACESLDCGHRKNGFALSANPLFLLVAGQDLNLEGLVGQVFEEIDKFRI